MAADVRALKDKASELVAKGKLPAAIDAWRKVTEAAPADVGARHKLAETLAKAGKKDEAVAAYEQVADQYAKEGLFFKASAVCKVIIGLQPGHQRTLDRIASLYARANAPKPPLLPPKPKVPEPVASFVDIELEVELEPPRSASGLPSIPLFSTLTEAELKEIMGTAMEVKSFTAGEILLAEGAPGDSMFAIAEGTAGVFRGFGSPHERRVATAEPGQILGEVAMISGAPRVASVVADTEGVALEFSRDAMVRVVTAHPRVKQMLNQFYRGRLLENALRASPILRALPEADAAALTQAFKPGAFPDGAAIITEGQPTDGVHMLLRGACAVTHKSGARYPDLREGDLFGEVSMLTEGPATATVTAQGPVLTLRLSPEDFRARVLQDSAAMLQVKKLAKARLDRTAKLDQDAPDAIEPVEDSRV